MVATQRQVDIPASRARIGMHVVGLDRPWQEVPVLFQSFVIDQPEQVEILRTHCQWVTVERTAYTEQVAAEAAAHRKAIADGSGFEAERPLTEELPHAHRRYQQAQHYIDSLLRRVAQGRSLPRVINLNEGQTAADGNTYSIRKALPDGVPGFSLADHIRHQGGQHPGMPSSSTPERR